MCIRDRRHLDLDARAHGVAFLTRESHCFAGEELEDVASARCLTDAVGERLPLFARQQASQLFATRENLRAGAIQNVEPLLWRGARPLLERLARRGDCLIEVGHRAAREFTNDVAEVGWIDVAVP